jgi:hypothetical protein
MRRHVELVTAPVVAEDLQVDAIQVSGVQRALLRCRGGDEEDFFYDVTVPWAEKSQKRRTFLSLNVAVRLSVRHKF